MKKPKHTRISLDQVGPGTHLIARRKLAGPGTHYGVLFRNPPYLDQVVHKDTTGYHIVTVVEFAHGRNTWIELSAPPERWNEMVAAANAALSKSEAFNILTANCESFARGVVTGKAQSGQADGLVLLGLFALVVGLANSK